MKHVMLILSLAFTLGAIASDRTAESIEARVKALQRRIEARKGTHGAGGARPAKHSGKEAFDWDEGKKAYVSALETWRVWMATDTSDLQPFPVPGWETFRAIGELDVPDDKPEKDAVDAELSRLKGLGYTWVVASWSGRGSLPAFLALVRQAKGDGFRVLLTLSSREGSSESIYASQAPAILGTILPECDAFMPLWRRGDLNHWEDPKKAEAYANGLCAAARGAVPTIPLIGTVFVTRTFKVTGLMVYAPTFTSAALVTNVGYSGLNVASLRDALTRAIPEKPLAILVVGDVPYYGSLNFKLAKKESPWTAKRRIEDQCHGAGFRTMTLYGDGSGGRTLSGRVCDDRIGTLKVKKERIGP